MDRKKELKEQYKNMRPDMGIFMVHSKSSGKCHIESTKDLKSKINRTKFQLELGSHPDRELQEEWDNYGEKDFIIEILEKLKYDKNEPDRDYTEDLELLKIMWEEKLLQKGMKFYKS